MSTLSDNEFKRLMASLKDMSESMTRVESERELQKNVRDDICDELDIDKKVFTKLARTYHKKNFDDEVELNHQFETLYDKILTAKAK